MKLKKILAVVMVTIITTNSVIPTVASESVASIEKTSENNTDIANGEMPETELVDSVEDEGKLEDIYLEEQAEENEINEGIQPLEQLSIEENVFLDSMVLEDNADLVTDYIATGTCGENISWTLDEAGTLVIFGAGSIADLEYEDTYFKGKQTQIQKVVIESGITAVGAYLFVGCNNITSVEISNTVVSIGDGAFYKCSELTSIKIPDNVNYIGEYAFTSCTKLQSIDIPSGVTSIKKNTFVNCVSLASIKISYGVTTIEEYAFSGCKGITMIEIPTSVIYIGRHAFDGCEKITSIEIPYGVTTIEEYAFSGCEGITMIEIPTSVNYIERHAFDGCKEITSIEIPNGVTSIGESAFAGCTRLQLVDIPESVNLMGEDAFKDCSKDMTVYCCEGSYANTYAKQKGFSCKYTKVVERSGTLDSNISWTLDENGILTISGEGVIRDFYSFSTHFEKIQKCIKKVVIERGITSIGEYLFNGCTELTFVELPDTMTVIGCCAFNGCTSLTSVKLPNSVTNIESHAFYGCESLTSIDIPENMRFIDYCAFICTGLTSIKIPKNITSIGESAFAECVGLTSVEIPYTVTTIGKNVFKNCPKNMLIKCYENSCAHAYAVENNIPVDLIKEPLYKIEYELYGGINAVENPTIFTKEDFVELKSPSRLGYKFLGWYENADFTGKIIECIEIGTLRSINLYAKWELAEYSIEYVLNGGNVNMSADVNYTINDKVKLVEPTRLGYQFKGWYESENFTGNPQIEIPTGTVGNKVFYAKWEIIQYDITYYLNNGINTPNNPQTFNVLSGKIELEDPVKEGFVFEGWYDNSEFNGDSIKFILGESANNVNLYAKWKNNVQVELVLENDKIVYSFENGFWNTYKSLNVHINVETSKYNLSADDFKYYILNDNDEIISCENAYEGKISIDVLKAGNYKIYAKYDNYELISNMVNFTVSYERREYPVNNKILVELDKETENVLTFGDLYDEIESELLDGVENQLYENVYEEKSTGVLSVKDLDGNTVDSETQLMSGTYKIIYTLNNTGDTFRETAESIIAIFYEPKLENNELLGICGENIKWKLDKDGILHIFGYGTMTRNYEFSKVLDASKVKTIKMYGNIEDISANAFKNFYNLADVQFVDSITEIGYNAFELCTSVERIVLPAELKRIESNVFESCIQLKECILPDELETMGSNVFGDCKKLESIIFPNSITDLSWGILQNCSGLTKVKLPDNIQEIPPSMFSSCSSIRTIDIPESVTTIGSSAFNSCEYLSDINIPVNVTEIGSAAFSSCKELKKIEIPKQVSRLESELFYGCTSLNEVKLHDGLLVIEQWSFSGCSSLKSIKLPDTVIEIGHFAFRECAALEEIKIPDKITKIQQLTFYDCTNLSKVDFPEELIDIEGLAFSSTNLKEIDLGKNVKSIGEMAFWDNDNLENVYLPDSIEFISANAFGYCPNLKIIDISDSVKKISEGLLVGCQLLEEVYIPNGVNTIGKEAFAHCNNLKYVYFSGTEEQWNAINIDENNDPLNNARVFFNTCSHIHEWIQDTNFNKKYCPACGVFIGEIIENPFDDVGADDWYYNAVLWAVENGITSGTSETTFSPDNVCTRAQVVTFLWNKAGQPRLQNVEMEFEDVKEDDWYYYAVLWAVENGITSGTSETTFSPNNVCTRAQVVTFLWNQAKQPVLTDDTMSFEDVAKGEWYYNAVRWAVSEKITAGTSETTFSPNNVCTRAQVVTFLWNDEGQPIM